MNEKWISVEDRLPENGVPVLVMSAEPKLILDACCGGRHCWFDKADSRALFVDIREAAPGHITLRPNHSVAPDRIVDFRSMPFEDNSFSLILFDPPHILKRSTVGIMEKKYGALDRQTWRDDLRAGFTECWRVLRPGGTLVFKWSSAEVPLKEVLSCFSESPLFGHTTTRKGTTHWMVFWKAEQGARPR